MDNDRADFEWSIIAVKEIILKKNLVSAEHLSQFNFLEYKDGRYVSSLTEALYQGYMIARNTDKGVSKNLIPLIVE